MASLALRKFESPIPNIAREWYDEPVQKLHVERIGEFTASADGACQCKFGDDRIGFLKPREDKGTPVVANEKIASDLAFLLHLPVPPVVVRTPLEGTEWDRHTALSLSCLGSPRHWSEDTPGIDEKSLGQLEALRVFWTWIGDTDHNNHGQNLLYQRIDGAIQLLGIDHSYIFGQGADALTTPICAGYGSAEHAGAATIRLTAVQQIEAIDVALIEHIARRLVGSVLDANGADQIVNWLQIRRRHLRKLLKMGGDND